MKGVVGMTTVQEDREINAIRAVVANAETRQSDADGFAQLLTPDARSSDPSARGR
jgi:hypothetical protein